MGVVMKSKREMIQRFQSEKQLREQLLIPLFDKMGFEVIHNHGSNEFGKDIILSKTDEFCNRKHYALIVKKGNITKSTKREASNLLHDIARQVAEAYTISYKYHSTKEIIKIDNAFIVCDGTLSDNASATIAEQWGNSKELYQKNTNFISLEKLIELVSKYWPIFFETYSPEHHEFSVKLMEFLDGEEKVRAVKIDDKIYEISRSQIKTTLIEIQKTKDKKYRPAPRSLDYVFSENKRILIVGESGSGKSQVLRDQVRNEIKKELSGEIEPKINLYIKLNEFSRIDVNGSSIEKFIEKYVKSIWCDAPHLYWQPFYEEKKIDFYLDGFDEIATKENREIAKENIIYLVKNFPASKFVITTRELSAIFNQEFPDYFKRYNLQPLDYKQSVRCLESIVREATQYGDEILAQIKQQEILLVLPRTPLTMQLISSLFSKDAGKEIPSNTTEVYKIFTEIMLGRWDKQRDVTNVHDFEQKATLLSEIAFSLQEDLTDKISYDNAVEISEKFLDSYGDDKTKGKHLVDEIIARSELLVIEGQFIRFKHKSFQEYFCAYKFHTQGLDHRKLSSRVSDPWWDSTLIFLCGFRKNANEIVEYVVDLINEEVEDEDLFHFRRGKSLGLMIRAGYQTSNEYKKTAIYKSLSDYDYCYESESLAERIHKIIKRNPSKYSIHLALQLVLSNAYYSKLTQKAICEVASELDDYKKLSFMTKLIADFKDRKLLESTVEKINKLQNYDIKKSCALINDQFIKAGDVKLLDSKEIRKLKKFANQLLKPRDKKKYH